MHSIVKENYDVVYSYMNDELTFEIPTIERKNDAIEFIREMVAACQKIHGTGGLDGAESYESWLKLLDKHRKMRYKGYESQERVPSITFFCVRKADNRIVGIVNIRKELSRKIDDMYAGNIGYSIRPSEQHKGYGKQLMKLAIDDCINVLKLKTIRAGCYEYNIASKKVLESVGMKPIAINSGIIKSIYYELKL